jgi:hypothetical protein
VTILAYICVLKNHLTILFLLLFSFCTTGGYYINAVASNTEEKIVMMDNEDPVESNTLNFSEEGQLCTLLFKFKNQIAMGQKMRYHERQNLIMEDISLSPETPPPNKV